MSAELRQASIHVVEGRSLVIPLVVERLPETIDCLGRLWDRKRELHLTVLGERLLVAADDLVWDRVIRTASGRTLGPVTVACDIRRVSDPERPELETLIVMAECPGLEELIGELSEAIGTALPVPPAHVTLYSTDPARGIGITDFEELDERARTLTEAERAEVVRALALPPS